MNMPNIRRPKMPARPAVARRSAGVIRTRAGGGALDAGTETGSCGIGGGPRAADRGDESDWKRTANWRYSSRLPRVPACAGWPNRDRIQESRIEEAMEYIRIRGARTH